MNILIVEDDIVQLNALASIINEYNSNWNVIKTISYDDAINGLDDNLIELFLLDVELNKDEKTQDGILLGQRIRDCKRYANTPIIFITSLPDKVYSAINDIHCFNYIVKPYTKEDLFKCLNAVTQSPLLELAPLRFKDINGIYFKIEAKRIYYISSSHRNFILHTKEYSYTIASYTVSKLLSILPDYFVQCHKQYIVNTNLIKHYDRTTQVLQIGSELLPIGRKYKKLLEERIDIQL